VYGNKDISMIHQITWIPIVDYLVVGVLALLFWLAIWLSKLFISRTI